MVNEVEVISVSSGDSDASAWHSDGDSDSSQEESQEEEEHPTELTVRGPGKSGRDSFDPYCTFPNRVTLDHLQVEVLREYCAEFPRPLYVCTMKEGQVMEKKGKMYFNKDFTKTYLKRHISTQPKKIRVHLRQWSKRVNIKMGVEKQALLTTKWLRVVAREALVQGDIVVFRFRIAAGRLRLYVDKLYPCQVCANL